MKSHYFYSMFFLIGLLMVGCTSAVHIAEYNPIPIDRYQGSFSDNGLTIAAEPFTEPERNKMYFGLDLCSKGILPVFIIAENHSSSFKYVLQKESFSLSATKKNSSFELSETGNISEVKANITDAGPSLTLGMIVFPPLVVAALPLTFAGIKMVKDAAAIQSNLEKKELNSTIIAPGERSYGFTYFNLLNKDILNKKLLLMLEVLELGSHDTFKVRIEIKKGVNDDQK